MFRMPIHLRDSSQQEVAENLASAARGANLSSLRSHSCRRYTVTRRPKTLVQETFSKALRSFDLQLHVVAGHGAPQYYGFGGQGMGVGRLVESQSSPR